VLPERSFYALPGFVPWMVTEVPNMVAGRLRAALSPKEQLDSLLRTWLRGRPMKYPKVIQDLMPMTDELWELKSPDLRIFGWLYRPKVFIASFGDYADDYKAPTKRKTYEDAKNRILRDRQNLDLDSPKFATGGFDALV
jgi:hypothetical protein